MTNLESPRPARLDSALVAFRERLEPSLAGAFPGRSAPSRGLLEAPLSPVLIRAAVLLSAALAGALMAQGAMVAWAVVIGLCYAPLVLLNFPLGLALWLPLLFLEYLPGAGRGSQVAMALIGLAWLGSLASRRTDALPAVRATRLLLAGAALLYVWLLVSLLWAPDPGEGWEDVISWTTAIAVFAIVLTTISDPRHVRWLLIAFVAGAFLSLLSGVVENGLSTSATALDTATQQEGRLQGGAGDPNILAAGLVPAIVLAAGLGASSSGLLARLSLVIVSILLVAGLAATESRGGLVAAGVTVLAALVFFRRHRPYVIALVVLLIGAASLWFAATPDAWHRITTFDEGGSGRTDLWRVAGRVIGDHTIVGVGLGNFKSEAGDYVRQPGALEHVRKIAEVPHVAHNTYLQLLSESGVVGLALFLAVALGAIAAAAAAAGRFERSGELRLATESRAVLVAIIAALAASIFLSNGFDRRTWVLLALAPVLLGIAVARSRTQMFE
jgi:O-antigen ligase